MLYGKVYETWEIFSLSFVRLLPYERLSHLSWVDLGESPDGDIIIACGWGASAKVFSEGVEWTLPY